jgi:hypothetical protein
MEGDGAAADGLPELPGAEAAARRLPDLRHLQQASGHDTVLTSRYGAGAGTPPRGGDEALREGALREGTGWCVTHLLRRRP